MAISPPRPTSFENIGARRLMTIIEKLFEDLAFDALERVAAGDDELSIDGDFVRERLQSVVEDEDLSRFVL